MLPTITWLMRAGSIPERSITALPTVAPRSVAGTSLSAPPNVPIAVRSGVETTMSAALLPKLIVRHLSVRSSAMMSASSTGRSNTDVSAAAASVSLSWLDVLQPDRSSCDDSAALVGDADLPQLLGSSLLNGCGGRAGAGGAFDGCGVDAAMDHAPGGVVCRAEIDHAFHPIPGDVGSRSPAAARKALALSRSGAPGGCAPVRVVPPSTRMSPHNVVRVASRRSCG